MKKLKIKFFPIVYVGFDGFPNNIVQFIESLKPKDFIDIKIDNAFRGIDYYNITIIYQKDEEN